MSDFRRMAAVALTLVSTGLARAQYPAPCAPPATAYYVDPTPAGAPFTGSNYHFAPGQAYGYYQPSYSNYYGQSYSSYYGPNYGSPYNRSSYYNPGPYYYTPTYSYTPGYYSYYYTPGYFRY